MNAEQYRRYAKACFELAGIMSDLNTRIAMIEVARGWLRLAKQVERNSAAHEADYKARRASSVAG
jgi:hypothetical protein